MVSGIGSYLVMKILAFDPGAERMGFCCLESETDKSKPPRVFGSGYSGVHREDNEQYQVYRLRLVSFWVTRAQELFTSFSPEEVVSEIVPVVGGGNFVVATQSQLASTAITTVQAMADLHSIPVSQVGATTVKAKIGGHKKASKVAVRNGVFKIIPKTKVRKPEWTKIFDESDAFAIGLMKLGYVNG